MSAQAVQTVQTAPTMPPLTTTLCDRKRKDATKNSISRLTGTQKCLILVKKNPNKSM